MKIYLTSFYNYFSPIITIFFLLFSITAHSTTMTSDNNYKKFEVLDASEIILDGASTLVVTFSSQLDKKQDVANLVQLIDSQSGLLDGSWEVSDNGLELRHRYLSPSRQLTLNIEKRILSADGQQLTDNYHSKLTTRDRKPMIGFATNNGLILPSKSKTGLPVITFNVNSVDVNFYRLKPNKITNFFQQFRNINQLSIWESEGMEDYINLSYTARFDLTPRRDVQETVLLDLSKIKALQEDGIYVAVMSQAGKYEHRLPATIFSISNIGLSAHLYRHDNAVVFAQALDNGKPLRNVKISGISANNELFEFGETDSNGLLKFNLNPKLEQVSQKFLFATSGKQTSFIELNRNALDLTAFAITGKNYTNKQLSVFTPRDLYRPGETAYFNALLRDADGMPLPKQPIKVTIIKPDNQSATDFVWMPTDENGGFYQKTYRIPDNASTGKWQVKFDLSGDTIFHEFSVEEFLPETMSIEITTPSEKPILHKKKLSFAVKGWYLYGAPASNDLLTGQAFLKVQRNVNQLDGFIVGSLADLPASRHLTNIDQALNSKGLTSVDIDSDYWDDIKSPVEISLSLNLLSSGGRPVTRLVKQTIWPAEVLPAIHPLFSETEYYDWNLDKYVTRPTVEKGALAEFEIAAIDIQGNKVASNSFVAKIIKERRDYYWTWSNSFGWLEKYNEKEFVMSEEKLNISKNDTTKFSFMPDDWGSYRLEITDTNNNIVSNMRFWSGYSWENNTNGTNSVRPDQVKLSIDKLSYKPGDTAVVRVEAPTSGYGYLTVESNDGILWSENISVKKDGSDFKVPIGDWKRHDIYLSATVVRPHQDLKTQTVKRAIGLLYLPIEIENRKLNMTINAPRKVTPNKTVPIKIKIDQTKLTKNDEITVLLSAVDSGALNITKFVTPDPFTDLLGKKRYSVDLYDMYGKLIEKNGRLVRTSFGGDSDEDNDNELSLGGKKTPNTVKIITQQLKTIKLDEKGEGSFELDIPDFNGELRLMAQAWSDSKFGKAEQKMIVASPMIVELSTPRFLSGGDHSMMALDINNLTDKPQKIDISFLASGLVKIDGNSAQTIQLASKERKILSVPVVTEYGFGLGRITVNVNNIIIDNEKTTLSRSWDIGVRPSYAADLRSHSFMLEAGKSWKMPATMLTDLIQNTVESKLVVSDLPPLNIGQYVQSLFSYPYGCLEQTTSGIYPSLYASQAELTALGIKSESDEDRQANIQTGIDRILGMQRQNGSFGLWTKESPEEYWLTAYSTDFLLRARERGYNVNEKALQNAMSRLNTYLYKNDAFAAYNDRDEAKDYMIFATKAYSAYILAMQNKSSSLVKNALNSLQSQITSGKQMLSPLPIVQVAQAFKMIGKNDTADQLMTIAFNTERNTKGYYWLGDYGSTIRDNALILSLLVEQKIYPNKQLEYLKKVSKEAENKRYLSTQELNALFMAGWQINNRDISNQPWDVIINDEDFNSVKPLTHSYNENDLNQGLTVKNSSTDKNLYVRLDISGYKTTPPKATNTENTLSINRKYFDINGDPLSIKKLQSGDTFITVLEINAKQSINDALVIDLLPAGVEIENQNLSHSNTIPAIADLLKDSDSSDIKYQEYRDDRYVAAINISDYVGSGIYRKRIAYLARAVTPGSYTVPAPYVESMYNPELFAVGETLNSITVKMKNK